MVLLSVVILVVVAGATSLVVTHLRRGPEPLTVRVLVITMFPLETAPWLAHESLPITHVVPHAPEPLRCASSGLCVATIGQGKANAATAMSAILDDDGLDFRDAYFMTAGIAGVSPRAGTLGFAAWARWVVDWDLGHHLTPRSAPGVPHGYLPLDDQGTNVFHLDDKLVDMAYDLTKTLPLADSPDAVRNRAQYAGQAAQKPFTTVCDTVTGDDYWSGVELSETADYLTGIWTKNQGRYCTSQMEDNATATALARHGYLNRYLVLRTASDFDQPYPGQNAKDTVTTFPGAQPAVDNAYLVGSTVAHHLLTRSPR